MDFQLSYTGLVSSLAIPGTVHELVMDNAIVMHALLLRGNDLPNTICF